MLSLEFLTKAISPVLVTPQQCTVARHQRSACRRCAEACPVGCLSIDRGPVLDAEECDGCGLCTAACPTGALRLRGISLSDIARGGRTLTMTCRYGEAPGPDAIGLPCLGWLTADHLVWLGLSTGGPVVLAMGDCDSCRCSLGREMALTAIRRSRGVLRAAGRTEASFRHGSAARSRASGGRPVVISVTRKELFSLVRREALRLAVAAGEELIPLWTDDPARPAYLIPQRRTAWLALARRMEWPDEISPADQLPQAARAITGGCDGCGMCARSCPSGALRLAGEVITHNSEICLNCGLCLSLCPRGLVREAPGLSLAGLGRGRRRVLVTLMRQRCQACGHEYLTDADEAQTQAICSSCRAERRVLGLT